MVIKLTASERKWHGCTYYVVEPYLHSWSLVEINDKWIEMMNWCGDIYGPITEVWESLTGRYYMNAGKFWFRNESDRTMFILRWS